MESPDGFAPHFAHSRSRHVLDNYAYVEAARFIGSCFIVGAVLGFISALVRPVPHAQPPR